MNVFLQKTELNWSFDIFSDSLSGLLVEWGIIRQTFGWILTSPYCSGRKSHWPLVFFHLFALFCLVIFYINYLFFFFLLHLKIPIQSSDHFSFLDVREDILLQLQSCHTAWSTKANNTWQGVHSLFHARGMSEWDKSEYWLRPFNPWIHYWYVNHPATSSKANYSHRPNSGPRTPLFSVVL